MKKNFNNLKFYLLILLAIFFVGCAAARKGETEKTADPDADFSAIVILKYTSTFELGYTFDFRIREVLKGPKPDFLSTEAQINGKLTDGFLVIPPETTSDVHGIYDFVSSPQVFEAVMNLKNTGKTIDQIEKENPKPGTGMGSFLPPGTLLKNELYYRVISLKIID